MSETKIRKVSPTAEIKSRLVSDDRTIIKWENTANPNINPYGKQKPVHKVTHRATQIHTSPQLEFVQPGDKEWPQVIAKLIALDEKDSATAWEMGDLALLIAPMADLGSNVPSKHRLSQAAVEADVKLSTLLRRRDVANAWPGTTRGVPTSASWTVHRMLAGQPTRQRILGTLTRQAKGARVTTRQVLAWLHDHDHFDRLGKVTACPGCEECAERRGLPVAVQHEADSLAALKAGANETVTRRAPAAARVITCQGKAGQQIEFALACACELETIRADDQRDMLAGIDGQVDLLTDLRREVEGKPVRS